MRDESAKGYENLRKTNKGCVSVAGNSLNSLNSVLSVICQGKFDEQSEGWSKGVQAVG